MIYHLWTSPTEKVIWARTKKELLRFVHPGFRMPKLQKMKNSTPEILQSLTSGGCPRRISNCKIKLRIQKNSRCKNSIWIFCVEKCGQSDFASKRKLYFRKSQQTLDSNRWNYKQPLRAGSLKSIIESLRFIEGV